MLLLMIGISILILITQEKRRSKTNDSNIKESCSFQIDIFSCVFIALCAILIICGWFVIKSINIDDKIEMYTEQNQQIENQLEIAIEKYEGYEKNTYKDLKTNTEKADIVMLAQTFPELKSSKIVQKQADIYISNNYKIKSLKEEKINAKTCMFFICFVNKIW